MIVFLPIWIIWKVPVCLGNAFKLYVLYAFNKKYPSHLPVSAMRCQSITTISTSVIILLLFGFEYLICCKLETNSEMKWLTVFTPLIIASIISTGYCFWATKKQIECDLELLLSINGIQCLLILLKLDKILYWNWEFVFFPLLLIIFCYLIKLLYNLILYVILLEAPELRNMMVGKLIASCTCIPLFLFQVLIVDKLDNDIKMSYSFIFLPMEASLLALLFASMFSYKTADEIRNLNIILEYLMDVYEESNIVCYCCNHYAHNDDGSINENNRNKKPVVPHFTMESPD